MKKPVIAALMLAATAHAAEETAVPALVVKPGRTSNTGDFVVGYRFAVDKPMTVTAVGVTDQNSDGRLNEPVPMKLALWEASGKVLITTEVPLTTTVENGAFYRDIEPLKLAIGSYVIGAVTHKGGERFFYDSPIESAPGVRWEEGRYGAGTVLVFPKNKRVPASSYFGPVFKVLASASGTVKKSSSLKVTQPTERAVFQRNEFGTAEVPVAVTISDGQADGVEVRAVNRQTQLPLKDWAKVTNDMKLALPAGWYQLEFRAKKHDGEVITGAVERVGVGEVFVTCGQSNSANHGKPAQKARDDRVSSCNFENGLWRHGDDPQPGATGGGGSPWALLGDLLVKGYDVPVGFLCVGVGSTGVRFWSPSGKGYVKLEKALQLAGAHGCRAVLWHQGESDSISGTSAENYARMLSETITRSRTDAGWDVPWGVALASFHPSSQATPERQALVLAGQRETIARVKGVFQGPETDSFHSQGWLGDTVHFNAQGLAAHAQGWADALAPLIKSQPKPKP